MKKYKLDKNGGGVKQISQFLVFLVLILGVMASSTSSVFVRFAMLKDVSPGKVAFWRFFLICLIQWPFILNKPVYRSELHRLTPRQKGVMAASGVCLGLHFAIYYLSFQYISTLTSTLLVCVQPLFVAVGAYILFGEKVSARAWIGIVAASAGVLLVAMPNGLGSIGSAKGLLMAFLSSIIAPGYILCGRYIMGRDKGVSLLVYTSCIYVFSCASIGILLLLFGNNVFSVKPIGLLMAAMICIFAQGVGHSISNWALGQTKAANVSSAFLMESVFLLIWNLLIWREFPEGVVLCGGFLITVGILYFIRCENGISVKKRMNIEKLKDLLND